MTFLSIIYTIKKKITYFLDCYFLAYSIHLSVVLSNTHCAHKIEHLGNRSLGDRVTAHGFGPTIY